MKRTHLMLFFVLLLAAMPSALAQEWIDLLPAENLQGWSHIPIPAISGVNPKPQWRVDTAQKMLICSGEGGHEWLRYDKELGNYILQVEWRFTPRGAEEKKYNSGVGIRLSPAGELWLQAQTGLAGGYLFGVNFADGAFQRLNLSKQMKENRVKPAGEWNLYEIRVDGDKVTLSVNGAVVNEATGIGYRKGYLGLEAEGYEISFRNMKLKSLD